MPQTHNDQKMQQCVLFLMFFFLPITVFSQPKVVKGSEIIAQKYAHYLQYNTEYDEKMSAYAESQQILEDCDKILARSALTIQNVGSRLEYPVRKKVLAIIEAAKNDISGDIYEGFKTFDDATMAKIKSIIRVANIYECEIAILKARLRLRHVEKWADGLAAVINQYYYPEFVGFALNNRLETYQKLLPLEQNIRQLLAVYEEAPTLVLRQNPDSLKKLVHYWALNKPLLRKTDQRKELYRFLQQKLGVH